MEIKSEIKNLITEALKSLSLSSDIHLEHPDDFSHGDFSTNVAMVLAKERKQNPKFLAEDIRVKIPKSEWVEKTEVAGPGFINFYLSKKFFKESVSSVTDSFGKLQIYQGKTILVEHSSPNLFKPFHIGHMMNNAIGESVCRLAEYSGAKVIKISFPSDISLGIAKAVWMIKKDGGMQFLKNQKTDLSGAIMKTLGDAYARGNTAFEESEEVKAEIKETYKKIVEDVASEEFAIYDFGKKLNLSYFEHVSHRLGSRFDSFIFESEAGEVGEKIVRQNVPKVFTESEGAVVYEGEKDGLHTRVFINKEGYPTYEAKDIGLLSLKFGTFHPDLSIFITDHQQSSHFDVVLSASLNIDPDWKNKSKHIPHGRMTFKGAKMSSRLGNVPLATDILSAVSEEALSHMEKEDAFLAEKIAIAAIKFTILKSEAGKNINFDPETSLSFEGDSGPYLQYTIARCHSLLEKGKAEGFVKSEEPEESWSPSELEKTIYKFPQVVEGAISSWAPHYVATYLLELARAFNSWYGHTKVLDKENKNSGFNLMLVDKTTSILKNGLYILGIESPDRM
ncbi:MAG: arginyl-tRNA synthetase [Patescibacteria group bacterium]|nr:arginyl-tRNA synthetase [Patescibacteria group bacterium]